ncbi:MAG: hypothetical protein AAF721_38775 [Myxococcota bacterium]
MEDDEGGMGGERDGTVEGECGFAVLTLSGDREEVVKVGDTTSTGQGACFFGVVSDDEEPGPRAPQLDCLIHDSSGQDIVSGKQFVFHLDDFVMGPRPWTIEGTIEDTNHHFRYSDVELGVGGTVLMTGHAGASCTLDLVASSMSRIGGSIACTSLSGSEEASVDLQGAFCFERILSYD